MEKQSDMLERLAKKGDAPGIELALKAGADAKAQGSYALRLAADKGHATCVELLIPVSDPMAQDSYVLQLAAMNGHVKCVELLIPVTNPLADCSGALRRAAEYGHADCVELLIAASDPLALRSYALRGAACNGHERCVALLLPVSDPSVTDYERYSAMSTARSNGHTKIAGMIEAFIEAKELAQSCQSGAALGRRAPAL